MFYKYCIFLLVLSCFSEILPGQYEPSIAINGQTFLVYRRYYYIARLDKTIQMLAKMYPEVNHMQTMLAGHMVNFKKLLPVHECQTLRHKLVRRSIQYIQQSKNLKPLFMVWDSFKAYKFLEDELLVDDFSKEIFIITRNTIHYLQRNSQRNYLNHLCMQRDVATYSMHALLDDINFMTHYLCGSAEDMPMHTKFADISDLSFMINLDFIAFRFYCIKRVHKVVNYLLQLSPEHLMMPYTYYTLFRQTGHRYKSFEHWWEDIKQYKHVDSDENMRDFLCYVLLILYKQEAGKHTKIASQTYNEAHTIYQQIDDMPIEELLTAIDVLTTNIYHLHQSYQQSGLSFIQWLKQYWWVSPIIFSSFLLKFITHYYTNTK